MKKILKGIAALFVLYMLFIILYVVLGITRCSYGVAKSVREASYLPNDELSKNVLKDYLEKKYKHDFEISEFPSVIESGSKYHRLIHFSLKENNKDPNKSYMAYVTYKSKEEPTPIVACDNYYNTIAEPILKKYLDDKYNQTATNLHLFGQINNLQGFSAEVPVIQTVKDAEELINKYELNFNYTIFNQNHSKDVEEKINNSLLQYSDDFAVFKIISSYSDDIQKEINNSINLNKEIKITTTTSDYNETVIKSYNSK